MSQLQNQNTDSYPYSVGWYFTFHIQMSRFRIINLIATQNLNLKLWLLLSRMLWQFRWLYDFIGRASQIHLIHLFTVYKYEREKNHDRTEIFRVLHSFLCSLFRIIFTINMIYSIGRFVVCDFVRNVLRRLVVMMVMVSVSMSCWILQERW